MIAPQFPFRILVVEDDPLWFEKMRNACEKMELDCVVVESQAEAQMAVTRFRYHLVSVDQHIPESKSNPTMDVQHGIDLTAQFSRQFPLSALAVLTARYEGEDGLRTALGAGATRARYWKKSPDGVDKWNANPQIISQQGFAVAVRKCLDDHATGYRRQYFDAAPQVLPAPLATAAANLAERLKLEAGLNYDASAPLHLFSLWEITLELTHALAARLSGLAPLVWRDASTPALLEGNLANKFPQQFYRDGAAGVLSAYLDRAERGSFVADGSAPLRAARNRFVHDAPPDSFQGLWESLQTPLLWLMDAAAYFADHPLLTRLMPAGGDGVYRGRMIRGSAWPFPDWEGRPDKVPGGGVKPDRVYQMLAHKSGETELVDLFPLFFTDHDPKSGRDVPWVLLHAAPDRASAAGMPRRWRCRSLLDGSASIRDFDAAHPVMLALNRRPWAG